MNTHTHTHNQILHYNFHHFVSLKGCGSSEGTGYQVGKDIGDKYMDSAVKLRRDFRQSTL